MDVLQLAATTTQEVSNSKMKTQVATSETLETSRLIEMVLQDSASFTLTWILVSLARASLYCLGQSWSTLTKMVELELHVV